MFNLLKLTTTIGFACYYLSAKVHAFPAVILPPIRAEDPYHENDVGPVIFNPDSSTVWPIGSTQFVTWDTARLPADSQTTDPTGKIILRYNSSDNLKPNFSNPLASGFPLQDGKVQITVPNVPPRTDYEILLFGNSAITSSRFAITESTSLVSTSQPYGLTSMLYTTSMLNATSSLQTASALHTTSTLNRPSTLYTTLTDTTMARGSTSVASASAKGVPSAAWSVYRSNCGFKTFSWGMVTVLLALFF